jgi:hypothetical protein
MSLPEGYLPREGDVLIVHLRVKFDCDATDKDVHLHPTDRANSYQGLILPLSTVAGLHARHWRAGEAVRVASDPVDVGEVVAVRGGKVWVDMRSGAFASARHGTMMTYDANDLEPAPSPEDEQMRSEHADMVHAGLIEAPPARFNPLAKVGMSDDAALDAELAQSRAEEVARAGAAGGDDDVKF